eukprot:COSAG06_NODE_41450_length_391_cov_0.876712_1_plen_78_part_01
MHVAYRRDHSHTEAVRRRQFDPEERLRVCNRKQTLSETDTGNTSDGGLHEDTGSSGSIRGQIGVDRHRHPYHPHTVRR